MAGRARGVCGIVVVTLSIVGLTRLVLTVSLPVWLAITVQLVTGPLWLWLALHGASTMAWLTGSAGVAAAASVFAFAGALSPAPRVVLRGLFVLVLLIVWLAILGVCEPIDWGGWTSAGR